MHVRDFMFGNFQFSMNTWHHHSWRSPMPCSLPILSPFPPKSHSVFFFFKHLILPPRPCSEFFFCLLLSHKSLANYFVLCHTWFSGCLGVFTQYASWGQKECARSNAYAMQICRWQMTHCVSYDIYTIASTPHFHKDLPSNQTGYEPQLTQNANASGCHLHITQDMEKRKDPRAEEAVLYTTETTDLTGQEAQIQRLERLGGTILTTVYLQWLWKVVTSRVKFPKNHSHPLHPRVENQSQALLTRCPSHYAMEAFLVFSHLHAHWGGRWSLYIQSSSLPST